MKKFYLVTIIFIYSMAQAEPSMRGFGFSYDDVLLVPQRSSIQSRSDVITKTQLTKNIMLNIPIISANMDTVTEHEMAIMV